MNTETKQFEEIFEEHHNPDKRAKHILIKKREDRIKNFKIDRGL